MNMAESGAELSGLRKAAILLVMLGEDAATSVYRRLSQPQLQWLTREIADLKTVSSGDCRAGTGGISPSQPQPGPRGRRRRGVCPGGVA